MLPYAEPQDWAKSFEEHDLNKVVWEATMDERMSIYWHDALFVEADRVFPGIRHTNAGRHRISSADTSFRGDALCFRDTLGAFDARTTASLQHAAVQVHVGP